MSQDGLTHFTTTSGTALLNQEIKLSADQFHWVGERYGRHLDGLKLPGVHRRECLTRVNSNPYFVKITILLFQLD